MDKRDGGKAILVTWIWGRDTDTPVLPHPYLSISPDVTQHISGKPEPIKHI